MVFLLGFILGMAGLGVLIAGEAPWLDGRKVPARISRRAGIILVSFFPLVLLIRYALSKFEGEYDINVSAVNWTVAVLCLAAATIVVVRGLPATERKPTARPIVLEAPNTPFDIQPAPPQRGMASGSKKKSKPAAQQDNPFDFS